MNCSTASHRSIRPFPMTRRHLWKRRILISACFWPICHETAADKSDCTLVVEAKRLCLPGYPSRPIHRLCSWWRTRAHEHLLPEAPPDLLRPQGCSRTVPYGRSRSTPGEEQPVRWSARKSRRFSLDVTAGARALPRPTPCCSSRGCLSGTGLPFIPSLWSMPPVDLTLRRRADVRRELSSAEMQVSLPDSGRRLQLPCDKRVVASGVPALPGPSVVGPGGRCGVGNFFRKVPGFHVPFAGRIAISRKGRPPSTLPAARSVHPAGPRRTCQRRRPPRAPGCAEAPVADAALVPARVAIL